MGYQLHFLPVTQLLAIARARNLARFYAVSADTRTRRHKHPNIQCYYGGVGENDVRRHWNAFEGACSTHGTVISCAAD